MSFSWKTASYFPRPRLRSQTTTSIRRLYARNGYVLEPHTLRYEKLYYYSEGFSGI
jgi:hypothetical protein